MIGKFLFYSEEDPVSVKEEYIQLKIEIRELLKDPINRKVLTEILLDLKKDVSGSSRQQLLKLYKDLGLHEQAVNRLKSRRWVVLAKGISELTEMQVTEAYGLIKQHINHRSGIVRKQAQIATVSLKNEGISFFLDTTRFAISEWQQLKLLDIIRHLEDFQPPRFSRWLTSRNPDVVLFALRLIKFYKQNDAQKSITNLIGHKKNTIKLEAIQCAREFVIQQAREPMKKIFRKGNEEVKLSILDTLGMLGSKEDIEFLQNIHNKSKSHIISSKALSVVNVLDPESVLPNEDLENLDVAPEAPTEKQTVPMEKEEKEVNSIQLPEPDFKEDPMVWEDVLNPEFEDEHIFSQCCMEEFRDLIQEIGEPLLEAGDPGTLPLDFLPLVVEEEIEEKVDPHNNMNMEEQQTPLTEAPVINPPVVHAEERITNEIEALIASEDRETVAQDEEEIEFDLDFLPILVDENEEYTTEQPDALEDLTHLKVIGEELRQRVPEAFKDTDRVSENWSWEVLPNATYEAVKRIDWAGIAKQNHEFEVHAKQDQNSTEEAETNFSSYGFSIFQELFRTADTESKMILLDEVLAIGDEKEWYFLTTLADDPSKQIREKAAWVQHELETRLSFDSSELEDFDNENLVKHKGSEDNTDPLFELDFELDPGYTLPSEEQAAARNFPEAEGEREEDDFSKGTFLGQFVSLSHKILQKIYG